MDIFWNEYQNVEKYQIFIYRIFFLGWNLNHLVLKN